MKKEIIKDSKYWLKKCKFKTVDAAENDNYHSIVSLAYAENYLKALNTQLRYYALSLRDVSLDLCENDYAEKRFLSDHSRYQLIKERDNLQSRIFKLSHGLTE